VRAEATNDYDAAYEAYKQDHTRKTRDPRYLAGMRGCGSKQRPGTCTWESCFAEAGKLAEALVEFQRAAAIDRSTFVAQQEAQRTAEMFKKQAQQEPAAVTPESPLAKMAVVVELKAISTTPINLRMVKTPK
jgi:general secretion pathway protein D